MSDPAPIRRDGADPAPLRWDGADPAPLRWGYGTNGLADNRLPEAIALVADIGYSGLALTLDHQHLDPFADDLAAQVERTGRLLRRHRLGVVIETGARYVLDPVRKHHPTLLHDEGRERRVDLLCRAIDVAADLEAEAVSFWSGVLPDGVSAEAGWQRLLDGVAEVLDHAAARGVRLAMEPEPGMLVERLDDVLAVRERLGRPEHLGVTLDLGHVVCNEPRDVTATVERAAPWLWNVQVDDMLPAVHEHLPLGTGELDLDAAVAALRSIGYAGIAAMELPRHSHAGPALARSSHARLREVEQRVVARSAPAELAAQLSARLEAEVGARPDRLARLMPAAGRRLGALRTPAATLRLRRRLLAAHAVAVGDPHVVADELAALYRHGDAEERRAVTAGLVDVAAALGLDLAAAGPVQDAARTLLADALRTNDAHLVAVAMGAASRALAAPAWRDGVVKCLFSGIGLDAVADLAERADGELRRMAADLLAERRAAGRDAPPGIELILAAPSAATTSREV